MERREERNCEKKGIREQRCFYWQGMLHIAMECPKRLEEIRCWRCEVKGRMYRECKVGERKEKQNKEKGERQKRLEREREKEAVLLREEGVEVEWEEGKIETILDTGYNEIVIVANLSPE